LPYIEILSIKGTHNLLSALLFIKKKSQVLNMSISDR